jgi:hypothetical protein
VSIRTIHDTVLEWAGVASTNSLRTVVENVVVGEAMKPFLDYGWQPQVMAVEGRLKTILAGGKTEVYDVIADPLERQDLTATAGVPRAARAALRDYPIASAKAAEPPANLSEEESRKLASLGYVAATARPVVRPDAPRPADMASLFDALDEASALFVPCWRRSSRRTPTISTPRSGWPRPTPPSGTTVRPKRLSGMPSGSRRNPRTCGCTSRYTWRAATSGSGPFRCSSASSPRTRTVCPRCRHWR